MDYTDISDILDTERSFMGDSQQQQQQQQQQK